MLGLLNPTLYFKAKSFQEVTINKVRELNYSALFFEQGLGKTKMAIDVMSHWFKNDYVDTVIIFTKKILVDNWDEELKKHTDLTPAIISRDEHKNHYLLNSPKRLYVANFESLKSYYSTFETLAKLRNVGVILDESAKIKNPDSALTKIYFDYSLQTRRRLILTGTPVANRPFDIWAQIFFLDSGDSLGTDFKTFKKSKCYV